MRIVRASAAVLCLTGLFAAPAAAQGQLPDPSWGVELGVNFSKISPKASGESVSMKPGILGGAYVVKRMTRAVSLQVGVMFEQKRSELSAGSTTSDLSLSYVEIPVLAKLALFKGFYVLEGASFEFPVSAKLGDEDIKDDTTSPDVGLVIAVGRPFGKIGIEGRYDGGLRRIVKTEGAAIRRNRSFGIVVRIPLR